MTKLIITILTCCTLIACDKIHETTRTYPINKEYKSKVYHFKNTDDSKLIIGVKIKLSFKSDNLGYYNIDLTKDYLNIPNNHVLTIKFIDKDGMILYEMSPGWSTNDEVGAINNGVKRRGRFSIDEGIFREINSYEIYITSK